MKRTCSTKHGPRDDGLLLEDQLCFALNSAARAIAQVYAETLQPQGITYTQYLILITLMENDGLHVGELGDTLHLDSGTLTPTLKRMEAHGLVLRRRDRSDERKVSIFLTEIGRQTRPLLKRAREVVVERLGLAPEEMIELRGDLSAVAKRLRAPETDMSD